MLRAVRVASRAQWPREAARGTVTLAYDDRHRRRLRLVSDAGEPFLLDLAAPAILEDGDGLALSDGTWLEVKAAPEALIEVTAADHSALARLAWHLGNRHLAAQIDGDRILIRDDHVIADMLERLGARLRRVLASFAPEHGAYHADTHAHRKDQEGHGHGSS
jgi:urease accessory protein